MQKRGILTAEDRTKPEEVAEAMEMDVDEVRKLMNVSRKSLSLDAPLFEGEEKTLFSYLSDDETLDPEEQTFESARQKEIREMFIAALGCNLAWGLVDGVMYLSTAYNRVVALDPDEMARVRAIGKAVRDALFLEHVGIASLPAMIIGTSRIHSARTAFFGFSKPTRSAQARSTSTKSASAKRSGTRCVASGMVTSAAPKPVTPNTSAPRKAMPAR